ARLTYWWRSCTDHAHSPWLTACAGVVLLFCLPAGQVFATTYYVNPQGGADTNDGISPSTSWQTVPGTRTQDNSAFLRPQWGSITQSNKVKCGDTILLKGGTTHSAANVSGGG